MMILRMLDPILNNQKLKLYMNAHERSQYFFIPLIAEESSTRTKKVE